MKSNALSATLFIAAAMFSSCAGMMEKLKEHNDKAQARQEAQRLAGENASPTDSAPQPTAEKAPASKRHAPYKGEVKVAVFVTFKGELWQEGMQGRAEDMLLEDLAAHAQFKLMADSRMKTLGKLRKQPDMGSDTWIRQVSDKLGKNGPQVLLHVTLTSEEAIGKNKSTGKIEKYPKFTAHTSYCNVKTDAWATYSKDGHVFANGSVMNDIIAEFHERTLTEIMPAS